MRRHAHWLGLMLLLVFGLGSVVAPVAHQLGHPHLAGPASYEEQDSLRMAETGGAEVTLFCPVCLGITALSAPQAGQLDPLGPAAHLAEQAPTPLLLSVSDRRTARAPPASLA